MPNNSADTDASVQEAVFFAVERRTGMTWRRIALELGRLHAITLVGPAGTVVQTTEPTTAQLRILRACELAPPPRITTLDPA